MTDTTETLTARLVRLLVSHDISIAQGRGANNSFLLTLVNAFRDGQLIARDIPALEEPARIWVFSDNWANQSGGWDTNDNSPDRFAICYFAPSTVRSALLAAEAKGLLQAAVYTDEYAQALLARSILFETPHNIVDVSPIIGMTDGYDGLGPPHSCCRC